MRKSSCRLEQAAHWRVALAPRVEKDLWHARQNLIPFLNALAKILHHPYYGTDISPVEGERDLYRVKVNGRVRLVYKIRRSDRTIYLVGFDHRDAVYPLCRG